MDIEIAYECAIASIAAYGDAVSISTLEAKGFRTCDFDSGEMQCLIADNDKYAIVAIRGTTLEDVTTNAFREMVPHPRWDGCHVHPGYLYHALRCCEVIREFADHSPSPIYLTGHSLGGASAVLTASLLHPVTDPICMSVYGFGSPPVGDDEFQRTFDANYARYRFRQCNDKAPRPYWAMWWGGYRHCGIEHYITSNGDIWRNPSTISVLKDRYGGGRNGWLRMATDRISNHRMSGYKDAIKRRRNEERTFYEREAAQ